jgi:hypothetical protein
VSGLKKNLLSGLAMEDKCFVVTFQRVKVLIHLEKVGLDTRVVVGFREGNLNRLWGKSIHALVHDNDNLCDLSHRRLGHLYYRALPIMRGIVTGLPEFSVE